MNSCVIVVRMLYQICTHEAVHSFENGVMTGDYTDILDHCDNLSSVGVHAWCYRLDGGIDSKGIRGGGCCGDLTPLSSADHLRRGQGRALVQGGRVPRVGDHCVH